MYTAAEILPLWKAKLPDLPDELHQELAEALAEFSGEVARMEREACAKMIEADTQGWGDHVVADRIAAAIRKRQQ